MQCYTKKLDPLPDNYIYQNYHKHSVYTNVMFLDSVAYVEDYAKRAVELGHGIISSCEHGYQGRYIESFEMAQQYNLKFLFCVESYFVKNRFDKDKTNAHLIIAAKNENGRKAINRILSEASLTGFYFRPRIDLDLLLSLPKDDVWVTTACLGGINKYEDYENLVITLHNYFKDNFYLEVQAHYTEPQKILNKQILHLSKKHQIEIIAGVDSHYIFPEDAWMRTYLQKSGKIFLESEEGWFMDYPSGQELYKRFKEQGVLDDDDIACAMNNTNIFLSVEEYNSDIFTHDMTMPSALKYKDLTEEEKNKKLLEIVNEAWQKEKINIPTELHSHYVKEIYNELKTIFEIHHADYFLLNYEIIKNAVDNKGGMITFSGRGCQVGGALIPTNTTLKLIEDIQVGEQVISSDGKFHTVLQTFKYDIDEPLVQVVHEYGINRDNPTIFTQDHKILIHRNNQNYWIEAQNILPTDYVCCPKIKNAYYIQCPIDLFNDNTEYNNILQDENFWYFKVKEIKKLPKQSVSVYDFTVEGMHDYLSNNMIVHNSGPSFYVNHLLGFTAIDRINCPITLYPERFLSASRIKAGSLADIDFNCGNTSVFEESQREILGDGHSYPMIAYGTLKPKAAWKMYCRSKDVSFDIANQISEKIDEYEKDLKYWTEDSGEPQPDVLDYIPEELQEHFLQSKNFLGLITSASKHACASILYTNNDIKEEIGVVRLKSKGGKETIVACMDGLHAEKYLLLKNDLLTVACVKLIYLLYDRVGIPKMSLNDLLKECKQHPEVWQMYEKGYVIGLNQVEKNSTKHRVMIYKPKNISELSAFIAGIRPAFKSLIDKLVNREHFSYHIDILDKLLQTEELPESFILYQEQIMKILAFSGIPLDDCYTVIKSISKKRVKKIMHYKELFLKGMTDKLISDGHLDNNTADQVSHQIWGIIEDASAYGFNSSHSLSVSFDSLLAAYFKALYPLEFYEVYLNLQMERSDKAKALLAKKEAKDAFNISILPMRFGQDNRKFTAYYEKNALSNCLKSIKGFGDIVGEELYKIAHNTYDNFLDVLIDLNSLKISKTQIKTLIMLNYFEQFGKNKKLLQIFDLFHKYMGKSQLKKSIINDNPSDWNMDILHNCIIKECDTIYKIDFNKYIREISNVLEDKCISLRIQFEFERDLLDIPIYINKQVPETWYYVLGFKTYNTKKNLPYLILYQIQTGKMIKCSINRGKLYDSNIFYDGSIINVLEFEDVAKRKLNNNGKWEVTNELKTVIKNYEVIDNYNRNREKNKSK